MRELVLDGQANGREIEADGLSRWLAVELVTRAGPRQVLVRQLLPELSLREPLCASFLCAAQQQAGLVHPNVSRVVEWGAWRTLPSIVGDALPGTSLGQLLSVTRARGERLSLALALYVAHALLSALRYAASELPAVVHLDVRPERVHIAPSGRVRLGEFGLWSILEPAERARRRLEAGEVYHLAPELVRSLPCDARSDLFSVGAILFEMLTAQRAFAGSTPLATAVEVAAGRRRDVRGVGGVPDAVCAFIERMLAHRPEARFPNAHEALVSLAEFSALLAHGQRELREHLEGRTDPSLTVGVHEHQEGPPSDHAQRDQAGNVDQLDLRTTAPAEPRTLQISAPGSETPRGDDAPQADGQRDNAQRSAPQTGVVTQFFSRPFCPSEPSAPPRVVQTAGCARPLVHVAPLGEPPTLAPPPMSVAPGVPAAVAAAFSTFGRFAQTPPSSHWSALALDGESKLFEQRSGPGIEALGPLSSVARRARAARSSGVSRGELWRDPSRTVFFAKSFARDKTVRRIEKMSRVACAVLVAVFGSALLATLYLLCRALR